MRATSGNRWKSLRDIAEELGMNIQGDGWSREYEARRIRRALQAIEEAGIPLQMDTVGGQFGSGNKTYYKISTDWRI